MSAAAQLACVPYYAIPCMYMRAQIVQQLVDVNAVKLT
jgi:hypothetical protein